MEDLKQVEKDCWPRRLRGEFGDREQAIEELRGYLLRGLARTLRSRYGGMVVVEDVVQLALIKILESLNAFEGRSRFETWAMSIATRIGISELRKRHYRDVSIDLSIEGERGRWTVVDNLTNDWTNGDDRQRLFRRLQQLIDEVLSEKQRAAIRGSLEGLPVEEIATRLHSNRNAIYKLVHDARLKLRQSLEADGFTADTILELIS